MQITPEQIEFLRKQHVVIAMPCYGGMVSEATMTSLLRFSAMANQLGLQFSLETMTNESLVQRARNHLVAKFLMNKPATHLLFIDADIGFEAWHILRLLLHDEDIVGGLYPKKSLPIDYVVNITPEAVDANGNIRLDARGLAEVSRLGTGFMMVKREVFNRHMIAYPNTKFTNNVGLDPAINPYCYAFFDCWISQDEQREYLSEDWGFIVKSRVLGIKVFADTAIRLNHTGYFTYPGDPTNLYNGMGLKPENNPQLSPKMAMRKDEISDLTAALAVKPDLEALAQYEAKKNMDLTVSSSFANIVI